MRAVYCHQCAKFTPLLSPRETDLLLLLREGLTNRQMAERLELMPKSINNMMSRLLSTLDVPNRTAAVVWSFEHLAPELHQVETPNAADARKRTSASARR